MTNPPPPTAHLALAIDGAFPHSRADTRRSLAAMAVIRRLQPGERIVQQGDSSSVALVLSGHVAVRRTTVDGREFVVRVFSSGRVSPQLPLGGRPASADSMALSAASVAVWPAALVRSLASKDNGFAADILDDVLEALEEVMVRLDGLLYQDAERRVARILYQHADLIFSNPPIVSRRFLPALVGTSREMTQRVVRGLERRGVVQRVSRDRVRLLDRAGLAARAGAPVKPDGTDS